MNLNGWGNMSLPDENSLLSLFECEPKLLDNNVPFFYNETTYEFDNNNHERFLVSICPAYKDIKILVSLFTVTNYSNL